MLKPRTIHADEASVLREIAKHGTDEDVITPIKLPQFDECLSSVALAALRERIQSSPSGRITFAEFKQVMKQFTNDTVAIEQIYQKIDNKNTGCITFSEFASFLLATEAGTQWAQTKNASKWVLRNDLIASPITATAASVHRDAINCICFVPKPHPMLITGGQDGQLLIWDPTDLSLMASLEHTDKHAVYVQQLRSNMSGKGEGV
jgi:WD40 repeat protein